jgi:hypothetical protein
MCQWELFDVYGAYLKLGEQLLGGGIQLGCGDGS